MKGTHDIRKRLFEALQIKRGEKEGAAATKVLKSAGVFGVVEHRARPFADAETRSKALYRIKGITWCTLPPNLAGPGGEHAKMTEIGESDRMTLKFVKP